MPRPRTAAAKKGAVTTRKGRANGSSPAPFKCPECGKEFNRAASLGAHRNRTHGVTGASPRRASKSARSARATAKTSSTVDRDALLQALFPTGIPAKESVIRDVNAWLDQAERLSRQA
jgi:uncharacterized C2H2 Zn-finger protein